MANTDFANYWDNDLSFLKEIYQDDFGNLNILSLDEPTMDQCNPVQVASQTECLSCDLIPIDPISPQLFGTEQETSPYQQSDSEWGWPMAKAEFAELMSFHHIPPSSDPATASESYEANSQSTVELWSSDQHSSSKETLILVREGDEAVPSPNSTLYDAHSELSSASSSQPTSPASNGLRPRQKRSTRSQRNSSSGQASRSGPGDKHRKVEKKYRDGLKQALDDLNDLMGGDPSLTKMGIIQLATEQIRQMKQAKSLPQRRNQ